LPNVYVESKDVSISRSYFLAFEDRLPDMSPLDVHKVSGVLEVEDVNDDKVFAHFQVAGFALLPHDMGAVEGSFLNRILKENKLPKCNSLT
jgi:hypothetical protein